MRIFLYGEALGVFNSPLWQERLVSWCAAMMVCFMEILRNPRSEKNAIRSADFPYTTECDSSDCMFMCHEL